MQNKLTFKSLMIIFIISLTILLLGFTNKINKTPTTVYKVFIDGEIIGTIKSKTEFEDYVNIQEEKFKEQYGVKKIYTPTGVEIKKVETYDNKIETNEEVYQKIIKTKKFTVKGIIVNIKDEEDENYKEQTLYVLTKDIFDEAVVKTIKSFLNPDDYEKFITDTQEEIKDLGSIVDDISIKQQVTYKKGYISIDEDIYTNAEDLAKYLTYGTTEDQDIFVVAENTNNVYYIKGFKYKGKTYFGQKVD